MKKCPKCAEIVQSEAKVCRYCRYHFGPRFEPLGCGGRVLLAVIAAMMFSIVVGYFKYPAPGKPEEPKNLILAVDQEWDDRSLKLVVRTNLPNGTALMATLSDSRGRMVGQDEAYVVNGAGRFDLFTAAATAKTVTISAPFSFIQPERVQALIGSAYSRYRSVSIIKKDGDATIDMDVAVIPRRIDRN